MMVGRKKLYDLSLSSSIIDTNDPAGMPANRIDNAITLGSRKNNNYPIMRRILFQIQGVKRSAYWEYVTLFIT